MVIRIYVRPSYLFYIVPKLTLGKPSEEKNRGGSPPPPPPPPPTVSYFPLETPREKNDQTFAKEGGGGLPTFIKDQTFSVFFLRLVIV